MRIARLWKIGAVLLAAAAAGIVTPATAGEFHAVALDGKWVDVYVPAARPLHLSADGRNAQGGRRPRILVADPQAPAAPVRIPRRTTRLDGAAGDPTATFQIEYVAAGGTDAFNEPCFAFPAQAQAVVNAAVALWAEEIVSTVPIRIRACWAALGGATLGYSGGGALHRDFAGAPVAATWYGAALANSRAGVDLDPADADMHITLSAGFSWYLGTDAATPAGQMDLMTVLLHEVGHGLDFAGTADINAGLGRWGFGSGFPSNYERFVHDGAGVALLNTAVYPNNSAALASLLTSQNVWFRGTHAMAANGGQAVKLYAPAAWAPGSSYAHLDYATFVGTPNRLMVYALSAGVALHDPGPVTLGLLRDLGWVLNAGAPTYTLNVAASGATGVSIAAAPPAYAGTTNYSHAGIASGTAITLTAPAQSGSGGFTGWTGCDSTATTTCTIVMNAARTVTAAYTSHPVSVTVNPAGGGSASCAPNPVPHGGSATCTATANVGYTFSTFSGDCAGATCTLNNVTGPRTVTANFTLNSYAITATASPLAGGSVNCAPNPVPHGGSANCTATANAGYTFSAFSGDCTGATCTLSNVTGPRTVTASFLAAQTITFATLPDKVYGDPPVALNASASSGLPVAFDSQTPASCTVAGTTLTLLAAGTCTVRATQPGNGAYLPAMPVLRSFGIGRAATTSGLAAAPPTVAAGSGVVLTATISGVAPTGTVAFRLHEIALPGCAAVALAGSGGVRTAQCTTAPLGMGTYAFLASYAGDGNHAGSAAATSVSVTPVPGLACSAFTDVDSASPFCPSVEWLRNRAITLGCTATTYCPADAVTRLAMAAFMKRLGTALTPASVLVEVSGAALDPEGTPVVCATAPIDTTGFPRGVRLDARINLHAAGTAVVGVELVASTDGATWTPVVSPRPVDLRAGHWASARVLGSYAAQAGQALRFGVRVTRLSGTADADAHACVLRVLSGSADFGHAPFDAGR